MSDPIVHTLAGDGSIPNNPECPVVLYPQSVTLAAGDPASVFEALFGAHGWPAAWRNGIFGHHHFHSTAHEVLGIYSGSARVQLGGESGVTVEIAAGDVVVIPAGVGHKMLAREGRLGVVGAYPRGQSPDMCTPDTGRYAAREDAVRAVPRPGEDPVFGPGGLLLSLWK